jgi:hypothetical protein
MSNCSEKVQPDGDAINQPNAYELVEEARALAKTMAADDGEAGAKARGIVGALDRARDALVAEANAAGSGIDDPLLARALGALSGELPLAATGTGEYRHRWLAAARGDILADVGAITDAMAVVSGCEEEPADDSLGRLASLAGRLSTVAQATESLSSEGGN